MEWDLLIVQSVLPVTSSLGTLCDRPPCFTFEGSVPHARGDLRSVLLTVSVLHGFMQGDGVQKHGVMEALHEHVDLQRSTRPGGDALETHLPPELWRHRHTYAPAVVAVAAALLFCGLLHFNGEVLKLGLDRPEQRQRVQRSVGEPRLAVKLISSLPRAIAWSLTTRDATRNTDTLLNIYVYI